MKNGNYIFITGPNKKEMQNLSQRLLRDYWNQFTSLQNSLDNQIGIKFAFIDFDKLLEACILENKKLFKKFIEPKYLLPLFEKELKSKIEFSLESENEKLAEFKKIIAPLVKEKIENFKNENSNVEIILFCTNKFFIKDFYINSKYIIEVKDSFAEEILCRIFRRKYFTKDGGFFAEEESFIYAANKTGSLVWTVSRQNFYSSLCKILDSKMLAEKNKNSDKLICFKNKTWWNSREIKII